MNSSSLILLAAFAATAIGYSALAQEADYDLPEQCVVSNTMSEMDHSAMGHGDGDGEQDMMAAMTSDSVTLPDHARENMRLMAITMPAMETAMMIEDANVAFACAMIAHHQGAIDMANVMIEHGDDPEMIQLAETIRSAQDIEIEQMKTWLANYVK